MKILLDPGHGGNKPGAVYAGVKEADLNLEVALAAGHLLREKGHSVLFTRDNDKGISLTQRKDMINEYRPGCFVSIHCNAALDHTAKGVEAFYRDDRDYPLANIIQQHLAAMTGFTDRGVFQDVGRLGKRLTVLDDSPNIPAALVELGFIDNDEDRMYLTKNIFTVADILADAIDDYAGRKGP